MAKKEFATISDELFYNYKEFKKKYHYQAEEYCICGECIFFRQGNFNSSHGSCLLMARANAESTVSIQGLCDRYISVIGTDRNGKEVLPKI